MKNLALSSVGLVFVVMGPLFVAACGSEVTGSTGSTSSSSSSSSSGGGGSSGGDAVQDCADTCHKLETMNCTLGGGTDCNTQCTDRIASYPPECADDVAALYSCLVQNTTTCDFPTMCMSFETAVENCQGMYGCVGNGTCFGGAGMNGEMSCGCEDTCKGTPYSTNCTTPAGSTMTTCDCLANGASVGTCQQMDANACGVKESCCNTMYFKL